MKNPSEADLVIEASIMALRGCHANLEECASTIRKLAQARGAPVNREELLKELDALDVIAGVMKIAIAAMEPPAATPANEVLTL